MAFWWFMLAMALLVPLILAGFGSWFIRRPPRKINRIFGYRSSRSMKNQDTWDFAHRYCGKLWRALGWALLPGSACVMLLVMGADETAVSIAEGLLCAAQLLFIAVTVLLTEGALKKHFDPDGNRFPDADKST